jgi:hypothetical protein
MTLSVRLQTLPIAALAAMQAAAFNPASAAPAIINGGGATSPQGDYAGPNSSTGAPLSEFSTYNAAQSAVAFGFYYGVGSTGQTAFLNDDLTCDINYLANGGPCSNTPGGANTVHYATSDSALKSSQISGWSTSAYGQSLSGNLIQIPALGTSPAIPVNDTNVTSNGALILTDADLCGVFSGKLTDFKQLTLGKGSVTPASGPFKLVYRSDSSAATTLLTNHLAAVCTTGNGGNSNITFTATSTFASLFPSGIGTAIPNAVGEKGSGGVANYMAGLSSAGAVPQAIGYVSPDWTSLPPAPDSLLSNGQTSPLVVAALINGKRSYLPTTTNIALALDHPATATTTTPPSTAAEGAIPSNWVPVIQTATEGYPIVGYGTFDLAQCYSNKTISAGLLAYLKLHYTNATYTGIQANNGLVQIANAGAAKFLAAVQKNILANANKWATDLGDKAVCAKVAGR